MADRPTTRRFRRAWKIVATLVAVPVLGFGASGVASALAHQERTEVSELDAAGLRGIEVDNGAGSIRVIGVKDAETVTVTARISDGLRSTGHEVRREGDRLVIEGSCPIFLADWCGVRYTIELPSDLAVVAEVDDGGVTVTDMAAGVHASSDNGPVELARVEGDVELHSDNGSVTATGLRSARANATADNGSVQLEFGDPPRDVVAQSDNGSIDVVVPEVEDLYRVDARSNNGTVSTSGVGNDPNSERTITATSDNGDVTVTYALG